ncbi:MAG TPA: type Z 30S ribosomal protein S14 [Candidatus Absconditabacterales bacterium]|nr:type Z 30S ribosomal protein S14 [Candidatus Absconditabacterales bacterium]
MAREALKAKQWKLYEQKFIQKKEMKGVKYYNRCRLCGRSRGFIRDFGVCRVCLRKYAREGKIMGLRKASW